jgi:hypothetical protein
MWEQCRLCGSRNDRQVVVRAGEHMCPRCAASPLCDRCGHRREDHTGVFIAAGKTCTHRRYDVQSLSRIECPCEGFAPIQGSFAEATFAQPGSAELKLRVAPPR